MLSQALLAGASGQLRNMATVGGNLLQRTRCHYFYDGAARLQQARAGQRLRRDRRVQPHTTRILGVSEHCIATHPSDMCVALAALDAIVEVRGRTGNSPIPLADFHRLPGAPRTSRPSWPPTS